MVKAKKHETKAEKIIADNTDGMCTECGKMVNPNTKFYLHSECCNAHWELCGKQNKFWLECENCGKSGPDS